MGRAFEWLRMWACASRSYLASRPATKGKGDVRLGSRFCFTSTPAATKQRKSCVIAKRRDQSRVPRRSPPRMATRLSLITHGGGKKMAPCHEPRSEARRRRRRRDTTKTTTHANNSPRRSSRRIKRRPDPTSTSREPERATAVPSFISHPRRAVRGPTKFLSAM